MCLLKTAMAPGIFRAGEGQMLWAVRGPASIGPGNPAPPPRSTRASLYNVYATFLIVFSLALLLPSPPARAYQGPEDLKVLTRSGEAVLVFTPEPNVTYTVYRHTYAEVRTASPIGSVKTDGAGRIVPEMADPPYAWSDAHSAFPGKLLFTDSTLTDYQEYYYFVARGPYTGDLRDYVVVASFPPTQTRHGSYTQYTNACTACHGLHSSQSARKLLKAPTINDLCLTCHNGTGSKYDAVNGWVRTGPSWTQRARSPAGLYGSAFSSLAAGEAREEPTSSHTFDILVYRAPGSGYPSSPSSWHESFACTSCHEVHGRAKNFRLLRGELHGVAKVLRGFTSVYWTRSDRSDAVSVSEYIYGTYDFCGGCHLAFNDPRWGSVYKSVSQVAGSHRHPVGVAPADYAQVRYPQMSWEYVYQEDFPFEDARPLSTSLPLEGLFTGPDYNRNLITCLTCHYAHGTLRQGPVSVAYINGSTNGTEGASPDPLTGYTPRDAALVGRIGSTVQKRLDYAGICQDCHQK